jgi:hypothetical protein
VSSVTADDYMALMYDSSQDLFILDVVQETQVEKYKTTTAGTADAYTATYP